MTKETQTNDFADDFPVALLAERYVGGDMATVTAEAFEAALDDPELLEQLVLAVQVRDALSAADSRPQRATIGKWKVAAAVLSAAALGLVLCFAPNGLKSTPEVGVVAGVETGSANNWLAPVWLDVAETEAPSDDFDVAFEELELAGLDTDSEDLSDVPDWMYAAVSLPAESPELIDAVTPNFQPSAEGTL